MNHAAAVVQQHPTAMVEHRNLPAWCDAVTDQQTETVGQQPVALHPQVVVTAQPDQTGQREHVAFVARSSLASRQSMMHIDTRAFAENATAVAFLDPLAGVNIPPDPS